MQSIPHPRLLATLEGLFLYLPLNQVKCFQASFSVKESWHFFCERLIRKVRKKKKELLLEQTSRLSRRSMICWRNLFSTDNRNSRIQQRREDSECR